ncbi:MULTISPECIES: AraC family transcriptional regulator [Kocuria]|jgi:AraC-like DNA-binding protein|uniref:Helix-turn-helix domain-containing protein n=1 Tax=Kocuria oceani TaxID=988827 RepID=A0ABV9TKX5_9MICC|nr:MULTISPECIES: AraC family transcriptional regulator [Kocuria]
MNCQVRRSVFSTRDPAEGVAVLDEVFAIRDVRRDRDGRFSMDLSETAVGPVSYERVRLMGSSTTGRTDGAGVLRVCHVTQGAVSAVSAGDRFPRTGPFLFPQRTYTSWWEDIEAMTVAVDPAAAEAHARGLLGDETFRLAFAGSRPVSAAMSRYWLGTVAHLGRNLLADDEALTSPLLRAELTRSLTTALLHTFPGSFLDRSQALPGQSRAAPAGLRRAVAYIDEHVDADIGLAEIAAAAGMSVRGLQAAFRRELDTTPTAHLRAARLDAAHRDLVAADPSTGATVEVVAARWGFTHRGRFAAAYRDRYGRSPAVTLRT